MSNIGSWKTKGRRGQPARRRDLDPAIISAAQILILISKSGKETSGAVSKDKPTTSSSSSGVAEAAASPDIPADCKVYECRLCPSVFRSAQELGGHQTRHRFENGGASAVNPGGRSFECKICFRCFPSGQALGGHMRKHYEKPGGGVRVADGGASAHAAVDVE